MKPAMDIRPEGDTDSGRWPPLPYAEWKETAATLQLWTQIVGKVRLALAPWQNHSWHVTLYVSARGLTTALLPHPRTSFEIEFDFIRHELCVRCSNGAEGVVALRPMTVADFYRQLRGVLRELDLEVKIFASPNEVDPAIPFAEDTTHAAYDPIYAQRFWTVLLQCDHAFKKFRSGFIGKCSPVHFFWGSFDLAVTRFSGRRAPQHPGGIPHLPDAVTREAYSHEVSSAGFWPGGPAMPEAVFYSYAYPSPPGFAEASVRSQGAAWNGAMGEFILPYEAVRTAANPEQILREFLESSYAAAANLAHWDRGNLELGEDLSAKLRRT
ncbi:MAG: DUF5996 family protein [Chthoniobacterales bacterium]